MKHACCKSLEDSRTSPQGVQQRVRGAPQWVQRASQRIQQKLPKTIPGDQFYRLKLPINRKAAVTSIKQTQLLKLGLGPKQNLFNN